MRYLVRLGRHAVEVEAENIDAACMEASRSTSVGRLREGVEFEVYPQEFAQTRLVQYERPNSEDGPHEFSMDYGKPRIVAAFQETPPSPFFSAHAKPRGVIKDVR